MRIAKQSLLFVFLIATTLLVACSSTLQTGGTDNLNDLKDLGAGGVASGTSSINNIRQQALRETAMSIGAQSGLHKRSEEINAVLKSHSKDLDRIYDFNAMILAHNVLPPILVEGRSTLKLSGTNAIRLADRTYQIQKQARFVSAAPNWRDYVWMNFPKPARPDNTLLPKSTHEKIYWDNYVESGWKEGIQQANDIFAERLAKLKQDFNGMALYRILFAQHMVSAPYVAKSDLGITGDGSSMRVNDQVLRITSLPSLTPNAKQWKPAISNKKTLEWFN